MQKFPGEDDHRSHATGLIKNLRTMNESLERPGVEGGRGRGLWVWG